MSSKHQKRVVIRNMPYRPRLVTAGQQTTVPETDAWQLAETSSDLDGMPIKRPGLTQWGQTIMTPDDTATGTSVRGVGDFLSGTSGFLETDNSVTLITHSTKQGALRTNVKAGNGAKDNLLSFAIDTLSLASTYSLRFSFQGTNLPAYTVDSTVSDTFSFKAQGASGSGKEFAIWSGGLYYWQNSDSKFILIAGSEQAGNGQWVTIEVRVDDGGGSTNVYLNETLLTTTALTSADLKDASLAGTSAFEFRWEVEGTDAAGTQYSTQLVLPMYNDVASGAFVAVPIVALHDYQYVTTAGSDVRSLMAAAGDYIYHDNQLRGIWRPILAKSYSNVYFARYRTTVVWSDNSGSSTAVVWQWDGREDPELLAKAPPVRFLVEHQQRLFGWGDVANPRRVYYSADRQPNKWFAPAPDNIEDEFSTVIEAGYLEIPSRGAKVTATWGDYYGLAVIFAEQGVWKLSGSGTFSYQLQGVTLKNGAINADSVTQVGNDLWAVSRQGIISLASTEQFGDLKVGFPSGPIQNLWAQDVSTDNSINQTFIDRSKLDFNAREGFVYMAVPDARDQQAKDVYAYNANTEKWFGPWTIDARAMVDAVVASPVTEVVMFGDEAGRVGYLNPFSKSDYGAEYTMLIESAAHDGRSLPQVGEQIRGMEKVWQTLRLFILPRGDFNYVVTWWTDDMPQEYTRTRSQLSTKTKYLKVLDDNFRLDLSPDGVLQSGEVAITHDIPLDVRGKWLTFKIEQDGVGHDLALQGYELEALVAGYEEE